MFSMLGLLSYKLFYWVIKVLLFFRVFLIRVWKMESLLVFSWVSLAQRKQKNIFYKFFQLVLQFY